MSTRQANTNATKAPAAVQMAWGVMMNTAQEGFIGITAQL